MNFSLGGSILIISQGSIALSIVIFWTKLSGSQAPWSVRHNNNNKFQETTKSENYRKQPYWALHTYFGKCLHKSKEEPTQELEI
jgi:hypothetical protein